MFNTSCVKTALWFGMVVLVVLVVWGIVDKDTNKTDLEHQDVTVSYE